MVSVFLPCGDQFPEPLFPIKDGNSVYNLRWLSELRLMRGAISVSEH